MTMMENMLRKVQLHFNMDELREIDDDTIDDDVSNSRGNESDTEGGLSWFNTTNSRKKYSR